MQMTSLAVTNELIVVSRVNRPNTLCAQALRHQLIILFSSLHLIWTASVVHGYNTYISSTLFYVTTTLVPRLLVVLMGEGRSRTSWCEMREGEGHLICSLEWN